MKRSVIAWVFCLALAHLLLFPVEGSAPVASAETGQRISDHFDGSLYFNPGISHPPPGREPRRNRASWILRYLFGNDWPEWSEVKKVPPGPPPPVRVSKGDLSVIPIGHSTFLIQMDGLNILTDPIWSERSSPVSWAGPKRHRDPGIRFEELPPIDVVLVSHNHYDHLDLPTLSRLAEKHSPRAIVPLGNLALVRGAGLSDVEEYDWWQSVRISPDVVVTLVPAQHFSSRTLWDRNETLWCGFVVSGPAGNVFFAGDTGYGPHFGEIARRFSPIRVALLPISPFRPKRVQEPSPFSPSVHMGPAEAVQAHLDLGAQLSIASHFQVFQLGMDGFDDAVNELSAILPERNLHSDTFLAPLPGRAIMLTRRPPEAADPQHLETYGLNR